MNICYLTESLKEGFTFLGNTFIHFFTESEVRNLIALLRLTLAYSQLA